MGGPIKDPRIQANRNKQKYKDMKVVWDGFSLLINVALAVLWTPLPGNMNVATLALYATALPSTVTVLAGMPTAGTVNNAEPGLFEDPTTGAWKVSFVSQGKRGSESQNWRQVWVYEMKAPATK